ncbi:CpaF family protein [Streptomyces spectabilis]|uniref:Flp pilus assembly CpaF family ATPase n=1 Tax=Streptomyces spectabilis TaxID=68270 RepID=A0A7W8B529_STRST|nr:ATPase, T2SS/T4P/T4SS family [Streptomyces spectabilis]MBB5109355.1 Flp pilus assembly CpaF family ATPase [Streptomyces spectabilis]GGV52583.1 ATP/GTP-binding protein [Streptomyces spectabilis]
MAEEQAGGTARLQDVLRASLTEQESAPGGPDRAGPAGRGPVALASPASLEISDRSGALPATPQDIARLRDEVSDDIVAADDQEPLPNEAVRRERARSLVAQRVSRWAVERARHHTALAQAQVDTLCRAVYDALFHAGPLQKYLDDPLVENVIVLGDDVQVDYVNRATEKVPRVAESDEELVALINRLASNSGHRERRLSTSTPMVSFRLPDGSRAEATILSPHPFLGVRRHGVVDSALEQLQEWGTLSPALTAFLHALVLARKNVLISGDMGTGKTSLLRALAKKIPAEERVVVLESDRELHLSRYREGAQFIELEARESNGELVDGRAVGQVTVEDMFPHALRMLSTRVLVGEVRDREAIALLQAMSAGGAGSLCTLHAAYPRLVLPRLVTLCRGMHRDDVHELVGTAINFIVYLRQINQTRQGGRRHRFVHQVLEVQPGEHGRPALQQVFGPAGTDPRAVPQLVPSSIGELEELAGFDRRWLTVPHYGAWPAPLDLIAKESGAA